MVPGQPGIDQNEPVHARASRIAIAIAVAVGGLSAAPLSPTAAQTTTTSAPAISPTDYVDQALGVIERHSFTAATVDMAGIRASAMGKAATAASIADTYPLIEAAIKATGDRHASFRRPVAQTLLTQGRYEGYGFVAVWPTRVVITVTLGGPAALGGLRVGDRIEKIDGKSPPHNSREIVLKKDANGRFAESVTLTVRRASSKKALKMRLIRGEPTLVSIPTAQTAPTPAGSPIAGRIGYVELPGLVGDKSAQTSYAQQTQELLRNLDQTPRCGWVVDLRRNRGGYIAAMLAGIGPLIGDGDLATRVRADGTRVVWSYRQGEVRQGDDVEVAVPNAYVAAVAAPRPVAVLTSALTASAAEATALAFAGRPNARLFGEPTVGLTSYTVLAVLPDGASITVTNALDADATGKTHDGPIPPDERVSVDWNNVGTPNDPVLSAGVRWLTNQPGCAV